MSEADDSHLPSDPSDADVCDFFLQQNLPDLERRIAASGAAEDQEHAQDHRHRTLNLYLLALARGDAASIESLARRLAGEELYLNLDRSKTLLDYDRLNERLIQRREALAFKNELRQSTDEDNRLD